MGISVTPSNTAEIRDLTGRVGRVETKVDGLGERFGRLEAKVDAMSAKMENRFDKVEGDIAEIKAFLQGEVAAARWCIGFFFHFLFEMADERTRSTVLEKISSMELIDDTDPAKRGADDFRKKLLDDLRRAAS